MAESTYDRYSTFLINGKQTVVPGIRLTSKGTDKRYIYMANVSRLDKISQEFYNSPLFGWLILQANQQFGGLEINIPNKVECDLVKQAYHKLPTNSIYNGYKVATSIDTAIQAISEKCLMQNLKNLNAEYGCVIVMETSTGKINALVNLSKTDSLTYENQLNNAVCSTIEPGSLFHIYDVMQLLEDNYVDTNTVVEYKGKYVINENTVSDSILRIQPNIIIIALAILFQPIGNTQLLLFLFRKK
jgi:membrane peptidoglycan carboxypeptidase